MKKRLRSLAALLMVVGLLLPVSAQAVSFMPAPQTAYAQNFVTLCEGQQWFMDNVEQLLNENQKTIDTLEGPEDLAVITSLGFAGRGVVGRIPAAVGELTALENLFLSGNQLSGALPAGLYSLPRLKNIDLSDNQYSGAIPSQLGAMPALETLMLRGNAYTGCLPDSLLSNSRLTALDVSSNQLSGPLPVGLSGMTGLEYLAVSDNQWGGSLPDLGALTALKAFSAWGCGLSGAIPDSLYTLDRLQVLDLAGNRLTGTIAPAIGNLTDLQLLSLGGNELTGPIPAELSSLRALATLDLSSNELNGVVPDAFGAMDKLMELHLEENKLRGHLPESLGDRVDAGAVVRAGDNYLTGPVLARVADNARNFCDGAATEQYRMTGPDRLTINETGKRNVWPMVQNQNCKTGDTWLKPMLPIDCYTAVIENDTEAKVELTRDGNGIYVKVVALPPPADSDAPPKKREIQPSENIRLVLALADNTGSEYARISVLLTTAAVNGGGGSGGGGGGSAKSPEKPVYEAHGAYVSGYPDGRFGPADPLTREQAAKLAAAALGVEVSRSGYRKFTDVAAGRWSAPYIEFARKQGWLLGTGGGRFSPEEIMSRAEFAVCLARIWGNRDYDAGRAASFPDVPEGAWYAAEVKQASAMGLVQGLPDGSFHPTSPVSRAEAVTILNRLLKRNPETVPEFEAAECPFTDMNREDWSYLDVLEASVPHQHIVTGG